MGGCYKEKNPKQIYYSNLINNGEGLGELELNTTNNLNNYSKIALHRLIKHKNNVIKSNPCNSDLFEIGLRSALTHLATGETGKVNDECAMGLRYLRDRISVPRDMPLISARILRQSLEKISSLSPSKGFHNIPTQHRYDQDPTNFLS